MNMATTITQGNELYIPFRDGKSISNSQNVPRIYQSVSAFQKHFPGHYLGDEGITLEKYVPERHGRWEICYEDWRHQLDGNKCSVCGFEYYGNLFKYCPDCGAKMDGGAE
jgi:hypothetical protein